MGTYELLDERMLKKLGRIAGQWNRENASGMVQEMSKIAAEVVKECVNC